MPRARRSELPWWLEGSEETCPRCSQPYAWSAGVRCIDCDRDFCPICIVWVEREASCEECEEA
ncbi:MAG: hypothetical protein ACRD2J_14515 [Thermoanaerobaculia bacterium]